MTSIVGRGARRVKRIVRWTIRSQSGEQFIIATGNCSRRRSFRTAEDVCPYSIEYFVSSYNNSFLKPRPSGEVERFTVTERLRANAVYSRRAVVSLCQPVGGKTCGLPHYNAAGQTPALQYGRIILGILFLQLYFFVVQIP